MKQGTKRENTARRANLWQQSVGYLTNLSYSRAIHMEMFKQAVYDVNLELFEQKFRAGDVDLVIIRKTAEIKRVKEIMQEGRGFCRLNLI